MAVRERRTVDARARVTLPKEFAKATVVLEKISENELRIRKASGTGEEEEEFPEETVTTLSDRDRDRFLDLIENPPPPSTALRKLMSKHRRRHD